MTPRAVLELLVGRGVSEGKGEEKTNECPL